MSLGRDRLAKDWLYRATIQIPRELKRCSTFQTHNSESESLAVGLSGAVSDVHVNASDHELRCNCHVKDDVRIDSRKASATAGPSRPAMARARRCIGWREEGRLFFSHFSAACRISSPESPITMLFWLDIIGGTSIQQRTCRPQTGTERLLNSFVKHFHGSKMCENSEIARLKMDVQPQIQKGYIRYAV